MLKPQDIVVLMKLAVAAPGWTFWQISRELQMSPSAVHRSLERAALAGLYRPAGKEVDRRALLEFLAHGAKYVFPPAMLGEARGFATAWAAPPLANRLSSSRENIPVWPHAMGDVRGIGLNPIHPIVPEAARQSPPLKELLTLFDAIRIGNAREREIAIEELAARLDVKARST